MSWPNGFRRMEPGDSGDYPRFDTGEYQRLVESSYRSGDYDHVDPRHGARPAQPPMAMDDYGYGDPGYADPSYDGPRQPGGHRGDYGVPGYPPATVYPVTGAQEALRDGYQPYPVTGAQEVLRDHSVAAPQERQRRQDVRRSDPRLDGIRYDEPPRYNDARHDEPGYDEPLTDEAWYAELRRSGPGYPPPPPAAQPRPGSGGYPAAPPRPGAGPAMDMPRNAGPGPAPAGGPSYPRAAVAALPPAPVKPVPAYGAGPVVGAAPSRGYPPRPQGEYLAAPTGQVGLLTPPGGASFGPAQGRQMNAVVSTDTVAWTMTPDADELDSFDEFWQEDDEDEPYTSLLDERPASVRTAPRKSDPRTTGSRPAATGRRRGRSGDRRLWLSLGAIGVVAAGAIVGILKFEFPSGGAAHTVVTPAAFGSYAWAPALEKSQDLSGLKQGVARMSGGQATDLVARTYEKPAVGGAAPQLFDLIGGHLPNTSPSASIGSLIQQHPGAQVVPVGPMGGAAGCFELKPGTADSEAMCVWFDNDSFAVVYSPMSEANLAKLMVQIRPQIELVKK